ncbi:hypothetical protein [Planctomicrobium sp. SH664]|uniref:hypothetical protein n=1 Tax=Planctomicrobium sp. SH664 TaxID=3448125 RepID=UPI003F5C894D
MSLPPSVKMLVERSAIAERSRGAGFQVGYIADHAREPREPLAVWKFMVAAPDLR